MRVAILGAGIVGVSTAYECAADGHEVTVFERGAAVAAEGSFAPAGLVAPGHLPRWAGPGARHQLLARLLDRRAWTWLPWMWRWWRASGAATLDVDRRALEALARYSLTRLDGLTPALQLEHERSQGCLVLLRDARDAARVQAGLGLLHELGIAHAWLDAAQARAVEPGLSPAAPIAAALQLPDALSGNARQFAQALRQRTQSLGVRWLFGHEVTGVEPGAPATLSWRRLADSGATPAPGSSVADAVIVCAGSEAGPWLARAGVRLPLAPVHGCSVTAPLRHDAEHTVGPRGAVVDERRQVTLTRIGRRVRVAGGATLGGTAEDLRKRDFDALYRVLDDWFPGAAQLREAQVWKGTRAMLPDGLPVFGDSGARGVWLNAGHGSSGWALACGCARALADRLAGRDAAVDVGRFGVERLRQR